LHRPEAWTGNLTKAPIIFLASNPSFDRTENFPSWDSSIWTEENISDFGADRFTTENNRGFGATQSQDLSQQDRTLRLDGSLSEKVDYWMWVRKYAGLVLEKNSEDVSAIDDYVMTELVHCKSQNEEGVLEALNICSDKWFSKIMASSPAKLLFVSGAKAGEAFARIHADQIPDTWGCWANSKVGKGKGFWPKSKELLDEVIKHGRWNFEEQIKNSIELEIGGLKRLAIYIARPNRGASIYAPWAHSNLIGSELLEYWRKYLAS
jgi:hypothetical protein